MTYRLIILFILTLFSVKTYSDTWENPSVKKYLSGNGEFLLIVFPAEIPANYFKWKESNPNQKDRFAAKDSTIIMCHATLNQIFNNDTIEIWNKKFINQVAPVSAIISNDGKTVVTFDNWYSMGYGLDILVIYDQYGGLIKRFQLEDVSPIPINELPMTISSIRWNCGAKFITNVSFEICVQNDKFEQTKRTYNLMTGNFDN
jgi:hypothetical protein